jgi:hypothetical protein
MPDLEATNVFSTDGIDGFGRHWQVIFAQLANGDIFACTTTGLQRVIHYKNCRTKVLVEQVINHAGSVTTRFFGPS